MQQTFYVELMVHLQSEVYSAIKCSILLGLNAIATRHYYYLAHEKVFRCHRTNHLRRTSMARSSGKAANQIHKYQHHWNRTIRSTFDSAKSWECIPFWSRLKFGPRRSIRWTKHQNDSDSSLITYNIGDRRSLIPCKSNTKNKASKTHSLTFTICHTRINYLWGYSDFIFTKGFDFIITETDKT